MYNKEVNAGRKSIYAKYLVEHLPSDVEIFTFPTFEEFTETVKFLPNWKARVLTQYTIFSIKKPPQYTKIYIF